MRFHRSESLFAMLLGILLACGVTMALALARLKSIEATAPATELGSVINGTFFLISLSAVLLVASLGFGVFLIYPLIRTQVAEGGKLREMTESLSARSQTLEHAALTDGLTGMHNRRYFDDALREYLDEFRRIERPVGLMVLDLDHFKMVNDTYGHDTGDVVLKAVAECLKEMTRYHDIVSRLGGEEFAVVAPNMDLDSLRRLAERIRRAIAALVISHGNVKLKITTSVGLAVWDRKETMEQFYRRADSQLYQAKRQGRDRVSA